jgi:hypothetical protein
MVKDFTIFDEGYIPEVHMLCLLLLCFDTFACLY